MKKMYILGLILMSASSLAFGMKTVKEEEEESISLKNCGKWTEFKKLLNPNKDSQSERVDPVASKKRDLLAELFTSWMNISLSQRYVLRSMKAVEEQKDDPVGFIKDVIDKISYNGANAFENLPQGVVEGVHTNLKNEMERIKSDYCGELFALKVHYWCCRNELKGRVGAAMNPKSDLRLYDEWIGSLFEINMPCPHFCAEIKRVVRHVKDPEELEKEAVKLYDFLRNNIQNTAQSNTDLWSRLSPDRVSFIVSWVKEDFRFLNTAILRLYDEKGYFRENSVEGIEMRNSSKILGYSLTQWQKSCKYLKPEVDPFINDLKTRGDLKFPLSSENKLSEDFILPLLKMLWESTNDPIEATQHCLNGIIKDLDAIS